MQIIVDAGVNDVIQARHFSPLTMQIYIYLHFLQLSVF